MRRSSGFTLIELLVVIAIIGVLSSVILASLSLARQRSQYSAARQEMASFTKAVVIAQGEADKQLRLITGAGCSRCQCTAGTDLRGVGGTCYAAWVNVLTKVQAATGGIVQNLNMFRDPWGSPYLLDENEGEQVGNPCVADQLTTYGPDGMSGGGDDITMNLPYYRGSCP